MSLDKRLWKQDLLRLKWHIALFCIVLGLLVAGYVAARFFRDAMREAEFGYQVNFDTVSLELQQIEEAEATIRRYIDDFAVMQRRGALAPEDRVSLLEDFRLIRERHGLFPISVAVREQESTLLTYPESVDASTVEELISLGHSLIEVRFPLLHEGDLIRFLQDLLAGDRLLIPEVCAINQTLTEPSAFYEVVEHLVADCQIPWYTLRRETNDPFQFSEEGY